MNIVFKCSYLDKLLLIQLPSCEKPKSDNNDNNNNIILINHVTMFIFLSVCLYSCRLSLTIYYYITYVVEIPYIVYLFNVYYYESPASASSSSSASSSASASASSSASASASSSASASASASYFPLPSPLEQLSYFLSH